MDEHTMSLVSQDIMLLIREVAEVRRENDLPSASGKGYLNYVHFGDDVLEVQVHIRKQSPDEAATKIALS